MSIEFEGVENPRNGYELGPLKCDKCGSQSGALLKIILWETSYIRICKGCLNEGEDIINKTILKDCKSIWR